MTDPDFPSDSSNSVIGRAFLRFKVQSSGPVVPRSPGPVVRRPIVVGLVVGGPWSSSQLFCGVHWSLGQESAPI
jgi:hypothetical protein